MNLSCMIIDDEPNAVNLLEMLILESTQWQIKAKCFNALEALAFLKGNQVDFIFLDINMPKLTGMELAALLPKQTKIVFTTAYSEYALESYSFQTIDYLLKPITLKRLLSAIQKIETYFAHTEGVKTVMPAVMPDREADYFFIKSGKTISKIRLEDILYFEGEREYVRVVTGQEQILIYRRLKDIEEQMSPPFVRVHNSYIVNTRQLVKMEDNHIYIADKRIPVGEKFKEGFMEVINKRKF